MSDVNAFMGLYWHLCVSLLLVGLLPSSVLLCMHEYCV